MGSSHRLAGGLLVVVACLMGSPVALAEYQELDAIVAVVEEDVVLASELLSRLELIREQYEARDVQLPPDDVLVSQLMEHHHQALQLTVLLHLVLLWVHQHMVLHLLPMVLHLLPMDNRCLQARLANNRLLSKLIIN